MYRRQNYLKKSGANEDQIESLIVNLMNGAKSVPEGKIVDLVNQLFEINISINRSIKRRSRRDTEISDRKPQHDNRVIRVSQVRGRGEKKAKIT